MNRLGPLRGFLNLAVHQPGYYPSCMGLSVDLDATSPSGIYVTGLNDRYYACENIETDHPYEPHRNEAFNIFMQIMCNVNDNLSFYAYAAGMVEQTPSQVFSMHRRSNIVPIGYGNKRMLLDEILIGTGISVLDDYTKKEAEVHLSLSMKEFSDDEDPKERNFNFKLTLMELPTPSVLSEQLRIIKAHDGLKKCSLYRILPKNL